MKRAIFTAVVGTMLSLTASVAQAGDEKSNGPNDKGKVNNQWVAKDSTNIDFGETMIDGHMQAPQGFFLQGRQAQSMSQMVKLRSKFRSELRHKGELARIRAGAALPALGEGGACTFCAARGLCRRDHWPAAVEATG